jgi:nucleoside-diphosphate-sugar epimerase
LVGAFRVNLVGAYNVCRAAVENGIRRVVHTGPQQTTAGVHGFHGYAHDFGIVDEVPGRPGASLYLLTKYLGQEVCRIFAEEHGLEVPTLLFTQFVNPDYPTDNPNGVYPMAVSWTDAADAIRRALDVPVLPHPFEPIHISTDLPHGKYSNEKAKRLLGWQPRDRLARQWWPGQSS